MSVTDHDDTPPPLQVVDAPIRHQAPPATRNPPAEAAVLGALLTNPHLAGALADELDPGDFHNPHHGTIWATIHTLDQAGTPADPVTVATQLLKTGDLTRTGGHPYLIELMGACPLPDNAKVYARQVRDAARLRTVDEVGTRLRQLASTGDPDRIELAVTNAVDEVEQAFLRFDGAPAGAAITGIHDLAWVATGTWPTVPPPVWGRRTDGTALFYAGRVNGIFGDPEAAKTWIAQTACIEAMNGGHLAAIVDVDNNGMNLTVSRMLLLGANPAHLADPDRFRYYEPEDGRALRATIADLATHQPAVAVLDSMGEMIPMLGLKTNDNDEVTAGLRSLGTPLAKTGCCVIHIDHLPKGAEARATGYAIGGTAKKRALDGAYLRANVKLEPAPGALGKVALFIEKDRPGELRRLCAGKYAGEFVLDSRTEHVTKAEIRPTGGALTADGTFRPTHLMETVSRLIEDTPGINQGLIEKSLRGKRDHIRAATAALTEEGYLEQTPGPRRSVLHTSVKPYREADDDTADPWTPAVAPNPAEPAKDPWT